MTVEKNFPGGSGELRTYKGGSGYRLLTDEERTYGRRKPDDPRAVRFYGTWFLPLELAPEPERVMPETRGDDEAYDHMERRFGCDCEVCQRPQARLHQNRWRRAHGLRSVPPQRRID